MKILIQFCCMALAVSAFGQPTAKPLLNQHHFEQTRKELTQAPPPQAFQKAQAVVLSYQLTSSQVRDLAMLIPNENQRLELAMSAYNQVMDRQNFYDVYDAFTRFSMVFRLHDYVRSHRPPGPVVVVSAGVSEEDFADMLKAIRGEDFENNKKKLAKQIISSKRRLSSRQIRDVLRLFDFEPTRLEVAKFAYDYVGDPDNYFVVNEAFEFANTKSSLTDYISKKQAVETNR